MVPAGSALLAVDVALLSWSPLPGASGYDLMSGDLGTLTATGGDFSAASNPCQHVSTHFVAAQRIARCAYRFQPH